MKKRQQYEDILTKWELLSFISDPYEKTKIADILVESSHNNNEVIVKKVFSIFIYNIVIIWYL